MITETLAIDSSRVPAKAIAESRNKAHRVRDPLKATSPRHHEGAP
jgi:hypothetical protein